MKNLREPVSALTHFIGAIVSIPIGALLIYNAYKNQTPYGVFSLSVFSCSLFMLYFTSALYHALPAKESTILTLKKLDHIMIFVLIAGSYTPICLVMLPKKIGLILFTAVWTIAFIGIFLKVFWIDAPRWLSTTIYVIMGWLVVLAFGPVSKCVPPFGLFLLILGGVFYTVGALIYALKKPDFHLQHFGFHEIFHLFVLAGSTCHVIFMFLYIK